jgi:hypothetical protein
MPKKPERSSQQSGKTARKPGATDDPRQADESGEPGRAGRSRGRVIQRDGTGTGQSASNDRSAENPSESGRHGAPG